MFGFLVRYCVAGCLWAVVIWLGVPVVKPHLEAHFGGGAPADAAVSPDAMLDFGGADRPELVDLPDVGNGAGRNGRPLHISVPAPVAVPESTPAFVRESTPEATPPPEPAGPVYDWGVLAESANAYSASGTVLERLPGGTVIEKISSHDSSNGRMIRCRVLQDQRWKNGYFVLESSLVMFDGPFLEAPRDQRELIVRYFGLKARLEDRRAELRQQAIRANPHFEAYRKSAKALTDFQASGKDLVAKRDAATGLERSRTDDDLRRLKSQEAAILHEFRRVEAPYKRWRSSNDDGSIAIASDELINRWENELSRLEPSIRGMVRGL